MKPMYYGIPFSPQATLTDTIGAADTIIKVSDVSAFPDAPNYATIGTDEGGETILYTAKTANALSGCTRGVEGSAKSWNAGELIGRNYTAADHAAMIDNIKDAAKTATADGVTFDDGETFQEKYNSGELKGGKGDQGDQGPRGPGCERDRRHASRERVVERRSDRAERGPRCLRLRVYHHPRPGQLRRLYLRRDPCGQRRHGGTDHIPL